MKTTLLLLISAFCAASMQANTITVTNTNDTDAGSLRQAVSDAAINDTINFDAGLVSGGNNTITLTSGEILVDKRLTFLGILTDADTLFISGNNASRIFRITADSVHVDRMAIVDGYSDNVGGGILVIAEYFSMFNSLFMGNNAANGGGLFSYATSLIKKCAFIGNTATAYGGGMGMYQFDADSCLFHENEAEVGGGLSVEVYTSSLTNSVVTNNTAYDHGGGIFTDSYLAGTNCLIHNNQAGSGGGWFAFAGIGVFNSTISNNTATDEAGGLFCNSNFIVEYTTVSGNTAGTRGGGITYIAPLDLINCTITQNSAANGGGLASELLNDYMTLVLTNSTVYENTATENGSGILTNSDIEIASSIVAFNEGPTDIFGSITISNGYNIFSEVPQGELGLDDQVLTNSMQLNLDELAFNGGINKTRVPLTTSYAIDLGNPSDMSDAQNNPVINGRRDIGAAESKVSSFRMDVDTCSAYTWDSDGNTYFVDTLVWVIYPEANYLGADSIEWLDLSLSPLTDLLTDTLCDGESLNINGTIFDVENPSGSLWLSDAGTDGCDSLLTVDLTFSPPFDVFIEVEGLGLTTISPGGSQYQWLNCNDGFEPIEGETGQTFFATENGSYAVAVTLNGCTQVSDCVDVISVGIDEQSFDRAFKLHPNPTAGAFTIDFSSPMHVDITISDATGRVVQQANDVSPGQNAFSLANCGSGVYFVKIQKENLTKVFRLVKH